MDPTSEDPKHLKLISAVTPPAPTRAWQSAPHPYLPLLATASSDKSVRIYSLTSFTLLNTISGGHTRSVRTVAWKPGVKGGEADGSTLATGSFDASAGIWRGGCDDDEVLEREVRGLDENDDSREADDDDDYRFAVLLDGHDSEIKSVAWSAHGTFLATCSRDKSIWVWELLDDGADDNYETVAVMSEHEGDVKCVAWHPADETCLASASYDESVRIWREDADSEWVCVALLDGHGGTVWSVVWEPSQITNWESGLSSTDDEDREVSGPRILSCSADMSIRLWRRTPKAKSSGDGNNGVRIRSIIRNSSDEEEWHEEQKLPQRHSRAIYSVDWSRQSRRVVSSGSDGKIVVYEERPKTSASTKTDSDATEITNGQESDVVLSKEWIIVAEIEAAHGVFEVNHVCWARRADRGKSNNDEEVIVSTGDDGEVKIWAIDGSLSV